MIVKTAYGRNPQGRELARVVEAARPFITSALIGGVLIWIGVRNQRELIKSFGDALVIAGVIGTRLEVFAANRIIEHASSEVAEKMSSY